MQLCSSQAEESFAIVDEPLDHGVPTLDADDTPWISNDETTLSDNDAIYTGDDRQIPPDTPVINGTSDGLIISQLHHVPLAGFNIEQHVSDGPQHDATIPHLFTSQDVQRLEMTSTNLTLPIALMLLDPITYPTQSRARKAIRKKTICFSRCNSSNSSTATFNSDSYNPQFHLGKVITRIYPGDTIGIQHRAGSNYYSTQGQVYRPPSFDIPIIYEDDHMAIVNKPAGIVLYRAQGGRGGGTKNAGHGRDTLLSALPHVLTPSNISESLMEEGHMPLKRPHAVHRLDRPTSGLVVIAKTKYAAVQLARQFEFRLAKKSYMAIVNGFPVMPKGDRDESNSSGSQPDRWNTIDYDLEEKNAVTEWRVVTTVKSLQATDGVLTLVEMRPKTGRYHQLRRHFVSIDCIILFTDHIYISCHNNITSPFSQAWVCNTPLVGDSTYDNGGSKALRLRQRGLFLCSNGIEIQHPYYNSPSGLEKWDDSMDSDVLYRDKEHGCIMVNARIDLPDKFESFLFHENKRAEKFLDRTT